MKYPEKVIITEVGPRDGLQNEKGEISTQDKIHFINNLVEAGATRIEVTSFVSPKWVPQMADAGKVYSGIQKKDGVLYIALTPNMKGLERALENQVNAIAVFTAASETFTKKNINSTIEESINSFREIIKKAKENKIWVRGYISTCFGCPYEGKVAPAAVHEVAKKLLAEGIDELSIGDTIGVATPNQIEEVVGLLLKDMDPGQIALHLHDTRGTALANVLQGLALGIFKYDSSAGGLGGCPYAPGAAGNLATEDLVYLLEGMGIPCGIQLEKLLETSAKMESLLARTLPSKCLQAHLAQKCP